MTGQVRSGEKTHSQIPTIVTVLLLVLSACGGEGSLPADRYTSAAVSAVVAQPKFAAGRKDLNRKCAAAAKRAQWKTLERGDDGRTNPCLGDFRSESFLSR
jgi:hypothetical protein